MSKKSQYQMMNSEEVQREAHELFEAFAKRFEKKANLDNLSPLDAISVYAGMRLVWEYVREGLGDQGFFEVESAFNIVFDFTYDNGIQLVANSRDEIISRLRANPISDILIHEEPDPSKVN